MKTVVQIILALFVATSGIQSVANAGEASGYIGKKIHIDPERFANGTVYGFRVEETVDHANSYTDSVIQPRGFDGLIISTKRGQVFLLTESHTDANGHVDWTLVLDAIDIPKGLRLSGKSEEDPCTAKNFPTDTVLVIGKWVNNKSRTGGYAGGYAYPINKAWRVDFDEKKLREISVTGIKCEDNRAEGEFD